MLISIDGIDGCGKSTQQKRLAKALGADMITEISPSRWGKKMRSLEDPSLANQLALFTADRAIIAETLEAATGSTSQHLVSDRSYLSSIAYQSYDSPLTPSFLEEMMRSIVPEYDLMIFLDVPVDIALARVEARGITRTWCETPGLLTWARRVFETWTSERDNIVRIDGTQSMDEVTADVIAAAEAASEKRFGQKVW